MNNSLSALSSKFKRVVVNQETGRVTHVTGNLIVSKGPKASIGDLCLLEPGNGKDPVPVEVVGFRDSDLLLMPLGEITSIDNGTIVVNRCGVEKVAVGPALLGRVVDGLGIPIDGKGPLSVEKASPLFAEPITSYLWDFGDTNTSTDPNPVHTYTSAGVYTVTLTVSDDQDGTNETHQIVTITDSSPAGELPVAQIATGLTQHLIQVTWEYTDTTNLNGFRLYQNNSQICENINGVFITAIGYPVVSSDEARLRVQISAALGKCSQPCANAGKNSQSPR